MSRDLTAAMITALNGSQVQPVLFLKVETATGYVRLWSGFGDTTWDSQTWNGAGGLLSAAPAAEVLEVRAIGAVFTLNGLDTALVAAALTELRQNKPITCWLAFLDSTAAIIADPVIIFKGSVDVPEIAIGKDAATITINAENELIQLQRPRLLRYTNVDQQQLYAGDLGFLYVDSIAGQTLAWGTPNAAVRAVRRFPQYTGDD